MLIIQIVLSQTTAICVRVYITFGYLKIMQEYA